MTLLHITHSLPANEPAKGEGSYMLHATYLTLHQTHHIPCLKFKIGSGLYLLLVLWLVKLFEQVIIPQV